MMRLGLRVRSFRERSNGSFHRIVGQIALRYGYVDYAIKQFNLAMNYLSNDIYLLADLQKAYRANCDWDAFYNVYERSKKLWPDDLGVKRSLAAICLFNGRYNDALPYLEYCVDNWEPNYDPYGLANTQARLGISYARLGQWHRAEAILKIAEEQAPWDPDVCYGQTIIYKGTGRSNEILEFLNAKLDNYPWHYWLYYWKANHYSTFLNKPEESLLYYEDSLRRINYWKYGKTYQPYYFSLSTYATPTDVFSDYVENAIKCNKTKLISLKINIGQFIYGEDSLDRHYLRIHFEILRGRHSQAEAKCLNILDKRLAPITKVRFFALLAYSQLMQGKLDEALLSASTALSMDPICYLAWDTLGMAQTAKADWERATESYTQMTQFEPYDIKWFKGLAQCQKEVGNLQGARKAYEQIVELAPRDGEAWIELGDIYFLLKELDEADEAYKEGLMVDVQDTVKKEHAVQRRQNLKRSGKHSK